MRLNLCLLFILPALFVLCDAAPSLFSKQGVASSDESFAHEFKKAALHRLEVYKKSAKKDFVAKESSAKKDKVYLSAFPKHSHYKRYA